MTVTQTVEPEPTLWPAIHHNMASKQAFKLLHNLPSCGESDLWQAAVSSDGRRAHVMCLIYYTAGSLSQATQEGGRCTGRWDRGEGTKVANLLGEKTLLSTSAFEGKVKTNSEVRRKEWPMFAAETFVHVWKVRQQVAAALTPLRAFPFLFLNNSLSLCAHLWWKMTPVWFCAFASGMASSQAHGESQNLGPRKQWAAEPSQTVVQRLANASLMSSGSLPSANQSLAGSARENMIIAFFNLNSLRQCNGFFYLGVSEEPGEDSQRRRWDKDPPERLLRLLEKAQLCRASSTFLISRGGPLMCFSVVDDMNGTLWW